MWLTNYCWIIKNYWTRLSKILWFVSGNQIICLSLQLRQIIDLWDTDKSPYFAITEVNNCFIIRLPNLFSYFNHFLATQRSDLSFFSQEHGSITHEQNIICSNTCLDGTMHEQTIICRQLFAGHMVGSRPMKRKEKMHCMITLFNSILSYIPAVQIYWHHKWLRKVPLRKIFEKISCILNNDTIVINITTNILTKLHHPKTPIIWKPIFFEVRLAMQVNKSFWYLG